MKRPKAVFLTQFFPPETFAGANRAYALARAVAETHELTVVTVHPSYPHQRCYAAEETVHVDPESPFPIHRRFRISPHRHRSSVRRALHELLAATVMGVRTLRLPADVVITTLPSMFLGPVAVLVARVKRAAVVWDLRDVTWMMAVEKTQSSGHLGLLASLLKSAMWAGAKNCDLLVAATPGIAKMVIDAGVSARRVVTVENGITDQLRAALAEGRTRAARVRPVVTYVGLLGQAQQLTTLVKAAQQLPDVDFVIAGEGPQRADMDRLIRRAGCTNVRLIGYVPPARLPELFAESDLLFAQVVDSPTLNQTARPSKLLEYMAAGRPIVYAGNGDAAALIDAIGCGVCTPPGDADAIAETISRLLRDRQRLDRLSRRGAAYVDGLPSRQQRMRQLAEVMSERFSKAGQLR